MQSFDSKASTEALLKELAGAGDGEGMAMSVRKAGWLATQMKHQKKRSRRRPQNPPQLLVPMMLMALARASGYAPVKVVACGGFGCQRTVLIQHEAVEATELAASPIR